ncbi:FkbM family methyltransferase [Chitinophaga nivalis]|uniref:FkbM family methyltransferase n=1 Tax=Chitinophaga nivalis TaxID=2991709 RepID=A0ABT3IEP4_9BACT|nr:FkbM family methyltransferase [Chitinophaga nivalis]MCW3467872.1 FkbM family methyltransferase [Chitinophaga nivalis]MCW3482437.1 FkbM family methyltransferase [Chitinophaga nivalis]
MSSIKTIASRLASRFFPQFRYSVRAYSSEGEDLILKRIFHNKTKGIYVDVGAHHPFRFSNTYLFYKMNWTGINIDPMPGSRALFNKYRPMDTNLEIGVSAERQHLTYCIFNEPALNTFSLEKVKEYTQAPQYRVIREKKIETWPLADILDRYLTGDTPIDFLTIDAEGLDMEVLQSNNWQKYRPAYVLVESQPFELSHIDDSALCRYMQEIGYAIFAKTYYTYFFKNMRNEYAGK